MKKGILCLLLSIIMIVPLFTACSGESVKTETEVTIYTLYTITDESTTPEAIRQVELALNRILFYRLGIILDLQMVPEDEYDAFIDSKLAEVEEYKETGVYDVDPAYLNDVISGDDVLAMLLNDQDIILKAPRVDIFLVNDYDKYYDLATNEKLAAIDEKLMHEGKELKYSIHSTLFNAAKIGGKTYGVPVNSAIGEYTYFAFDSELLQGETGINPQSLKSLADLEGYLEAIANKKYDNVVPLETIPESTEYSYLLQNGFPAIVNPNNGEVLSAYENNAVVEYFALIAKYKALGYIGSETDSENTRYAVRMVTGNSPEEASAKLKEATGHDYECYLYSNPVPTNENTIDNIFCISSSVVSNDLTAVIEIITEINTDPELMDLLTYGVEDVHYSVDDNGQIDRIDDVKYPYIMDPHHVGNCFITSTLKGENKNKWEIQSQQNQDAGKSHAPSLGFTIVDSTITYTDSNKKSYTFTEPEYFSILSEISSRYYSDLMNGTALSTRIDYNAVKAEAEANADKELYNDLKAYYQKHVVLPIIEEEIKTKYETPEKQNEIRTEYEEYVREQCFIQVEKNLPSKLKGELTAQYPDLSQEEIDAMVTSTMTDEYIISRFADWGFTEEYILGRVETDLPTQIQNKINLELKAISDLAAKSEEAEETPETETPDTETPDTETPETEVPETETPETEVPQTDIQKFQNAANDVEVEINKFIALSIEDFKKLTEADINAYSNMINSLEASIEGYGELTESEIETAKTRVSSLRDSLENEVTLKNNAVRFTELLNEKLASEEFSKMLEDSKKYNKSAKVDDAVNKEVKAAINEYTHEMFVEIDAAVKTAVDGFVAKCAEETGLTVEEIETDILTKIGYLEVSTDTPAEDSTTEDSTTEDGTTEDGTTEDGSIEDGTTEDNTTEDGSTEDGTAEETTPWFDFALKKVATSYYTFFPMTATA